jgi:cellulose biosynthesis protein BcsQ
MDYLNEKKTTPFEVQAFTNIDSLQEFAKNNEIEILLISTRAMCNEIRELPVNRIIILSEGEPFPNPEEFPFVYKYQSSDQLLSEVMEYYVADHPHTYFSGNANHKTKFYGVYSPVGRSRKTEFALTLGEILAETKQVLYLNFEEFSGFEELFGTKYQKDLSDLIYFARQKESGLIYKFNSVVQNFHELQYVPPALSPADIRDVSGEEWMEFLQEITTQCEYDIVILDLSEQVDELFQILRLCDRIYMPVWDDLISQAKLAQYEKLLYMLEMKDVVEKTTKLRLPMQALQKEGTSVIQQLVWGEMGNFVRKLLWEERDG